MKYYEVIAGTIHFNKKVYQEGDVIGLDPLQVPALKKLGHLGDEVDAPTVEVEEGEEVEEKTPEVVKAQTDVEAIVARRAELEELPWQTIAKLSREYELASTAPDGGWDTMIPAILDHEFSV